MLSLDSLDRARAEVFAAPDERVGGPCSFSQLIYRILRWGVAGYRALTIDVMRAARIALKRQEMADPGKVESKLGSYKEAFKLYEDGKHRRYQLLFAVNGGAFAIGRLFATRRLNT